MTVTEALQKRRAIPSFDPTVTISREELERLIDLASLAPSSMNLQPWEILVCDTPEDKARLLAVAMNQKKVSEASAAIVVVCNLEFPDHAADEADSQIERGYTPADKRDGFITMAHGFKANPNIVRDEAIRSCNLWAMSFMLVAQEAGWETGPMGGFFPDKFAEEFGLPDSRYPILIITIGKANPSIKILERNFRYSAKDITHFGNW